MKNYFYDYFAMTGKKYGSFYSKILTLQKPNLKFIYCGRRAIESKIWLIRIFFDYQRFLLRRKYGLEIFFNNIGPGFRLVHAYNVTISDKAILGKNITIFKGSTIGEAFRGDKKGSPVLGNNIWIGPNATIVGKVKIGDDVVICGNSYIDFDVASHTVVKNGRNIIYKKECATKDLILYDINKIVEG